MFPVIDGQGTRITQRTGGLLEANAVLPVIALHCKRSISSRAAQISNADARNPGSQIGSLQRATRYWLLGTEY